MKPATDNEVSVYLMYLHMYGLYILAYNRDSVSDKYISPNMYECCMNTKYLCARLKRYHTNWNLKQGWEGYQIQSSGLASYFTLIH